VGFVAGGPALTSHEHSESPPFESPQGQLLATDARNGATAVGGGSSAKHDVVAASSGVQR
jgi:hypothetical protein